MENFATDSRYGYFSPFPVFSVSGMRQHETICYFSQEQDLICHHSLDHNDPTDSANQLDSLSLIETPATVSYYEKNKILAIQLTLPSKEVFSITTESLSNLHLSLDNARVNIPLTNTPYIDVNLAQFKDPFMIQLAKYHLSSLKRNLTPSQFYGHQNLSSGIFSIFPRQELAFQYFDELSTSKESIKIFSFEAPLTGRRKFLVSEINIFHEKYRCNVSRHVYEIIREGYPCRLYFDLEYSKETNPEANGELIVELWISLVFWRVYEVYGILMTSKNIIHLDSSTEKKFSRHLIFLLVTLKDQKGHKKRSSSPPLRSRQALPSLSEYVEYLFIDNLEVGNFVFSVLSQCFSSSLATSSSLSDPSFTVPRQFRHLSIKESYSTLWLFNADRSSRVCVVDLGVYTRNRAFRLLSSSKYGKDTKLEIQRVSEAKVSKLSIPLVLDDNSQDLILDTTGTEATTVTEQPQQEDLWYLSPGAEWGVVLGNNSNTSDPEENLRRKRRCHEKILSDYTTHFNYFV
jgi:hypothetical protein